MTQLFVTVFGLGLALAAAPGALNLETLRRGLAFGFWPALQLHLGALAGDTLWLLVALLGLSAGLQHSPLAPLASALGGALLLRMAWQTVALRAPSVHVQFAAGSGLRAGAVLALSCPLTAAFWVGATGMLAGRLGRPLGSVEVLVVVLAYGLSVLLWGSGLALLTAWGRRVLCLRLGRWWSGMSAALLAACGMELLWTAGLQLAAVASAATALR